jgi:hypothetical protein
LHDRSSLKSIISQATLETYQLIHHNLGKFSEIIPSNVEGIL